MLLSVAHILIINFKPYEPRFYLFLVPLFGATLGHIYHLLSVSGPAQDRRQRYSDWLARLIIFPLVIPGVANSPSSALAELQRDAAELSASIRAAGALVPPGSRIIARKPHLPHYVNSTATAIPPASGSAELLEYMTRYAGEGEVYLYSGKIERMLWKNLHAELETNPPAWLVQLATVPDQWSLYRFDRNCCPENGPGGDAATAPGNLQD